jgi:RNA polymerase sigma-70 factor (ECF subfamily)
VDPGRWRALVERFIAAAQLGDIAGLESMLAEDVVSRADGGGKVIAARNPVLGRHKVARYLLGALEKFGAGIVPEFAEANGEPAVVAVGPDGVRAVCFFRFDEDRLVALELVLNPDKLTFTERQLSRIGGLSSPGW